MDLMEMDMQTLQLDPKVAASCADQINRQGWIFIPGKQWHESFSVTVEQRNSFARCWDNLALDLHMGDKGVYRYRRYSAFEVDTSGGLITMRPHGPYVQSSAVNPLNGGVEWHYPPLEQAFVEHPFFRALLLGLGDIYNRACGKAETWTVRIHPYRIRAELCMPGKPTPEGRHRDGVDFIAMMLIGRHCVEGGETTITDNEGQVLYTKTMTSPMDIIMGDDHRIMHEVSSVHCTAQPGHRDALVIAFSRATAHE